MNNLKRKLRVTQNQKGFTLVELLVVVAIIVALAAIVVPMTVRFASKGQEGASAGELDTVQTAMDAAMSAELVLVLTKPDMSTFNFEGIPAELTVGTGGLGAYMRKAQTTYQYCWDITGLVSLVTDPTDSPISAKDDPVDCPL